MSSPLPAETITLNATKLKKTIIKALLSSTKHHYYLMAVKKNFTTLRKCDETELTVIYHNYMASTSKKQDYVSLSGCLLFGDKHQHLSRWRTAQLQRQKSSGLANTVEYNMKTNNNPKHK